MHLPTTITRPPLQARQTQSTSTLFLTSTRSGSGGNILSASVADSKLVWWQLLVLIVGGALAVGVAGWLCYRHQRRASKDRARRAEVERVEREGDLEQRMKKEVESERKRAARRRRRGSPHSESDSDWSDESEDYDSVSDGGTIRPRRRKRQRRRERRRRRRRYSESEDSEESDKTFVPRRKSQRKQRSPPPTAPPPVPQVPKDTKEANFRDSVFSTYNSMKNAAVKLRYVEAKVKLKKQLEEEERIEAHRKEKILEANRELEAAKRAERVVDSAGSSGSSEGLAEVWLISEQPLIPPARRLTASSGSQTALPTPPSRAMRKASHPAPPTFRSLRSTPRQSSADSFFPGRVADSARKTAEWEGVGGETSRLLRRDQNARKAPHPPPPAQQTSDSRKDLQSYSRIPAKKAELGDVISELLGAKQTAREESILRIPPIPKNPRNNDFQASWLSKPRPSAVPSVPTSARGTVYVPMNNPRDRPIIPKGMLAPAPKPKIRGDRQVIPTSSLTVQQPSHPLEHLEPQQITNGVSMAGVGAGGAGGRKWTDRLRERR